MDVGKKAVSVVVLGNMEGAASRDQPREQDESGKFGRFVSKTAWVTGWHTATKWVPPSSTDCIFGQNVLDEPQIVFCMSS